MRTVASASIFAGFIAFVAIRAKPLDMLAIWQSGIV
jgi:hypothetical protein